MEMCAFSRGCTEKKNKEAHVLPFTWASSMVCSTQVSVRRGEGWDSKRKQVARAAGLGGEWGNQHGGHGPCHNPCPWEMEFTKRSLKAIPGNVFLEIAQADWDYKLPHSQSP